MKEISTINEGLQYTEVNKKKSVKKKVAWLKLKSNEDILKDNEIKTNND